MLFSPISNSFFHCLPFATYKSVLILGPSELFHATPDPLCCGSPSVSLAQWIRPNFLCGLKNTHYLQKNRSSWSGKPKINNWECTPESDLSLPFSGRQQRLDFCQLLPPHSPTKASLVLGNALKPFQQNPLALLASGWARLGDLLIVMDGAANPAESHVSPI